MTPAGLHGGEAHIHWEPESECTMKLRLFAILSSALLIVIFGTGCAHDVRRATAHRSVDIAAGQTPTGVVEFYAVSNKAVVPIYRLDKEGHGELVSAVGLAPGDRYNFRRSGTAVVKRLTVTAPTGTQQFLIDKEGPLVKVPVSEAKTTPVEIRYNLLAQGTTFVVYTADANVLEPVEGGSSPEEQRGKPRRR